MDREKILKRLQGETQYREMQIDRRGGAIDEEKRTVDLAVSSEEPYGRWGLIEILGHDPGEVRLDRINNSAAYLEMHDLRQQIGVVVPGSARIDKDRVLRATVRFSRNAKAEEVWRDTLDGIRTKISVGYRVINYQFETDEKGNETNTYRVVDWEPHEVSSVSVAADDTVGIGRQLQVPAGDVPALTNEAAASTKENPPMETIKTREAAPQEPAAKPPANVVDITREREDAVSIERKRIAEISASKTAYPQHAKLCDEAIEKGTSIPEFHASLLRAIATNPVATDVIGMSQKEKGKYSLNRLIRALMDPKAFWDSAGFEREISQQVQRQTGADDPKGLYAPGDIGLFDRVSDYSRMSRRTLSAGTATDGQELVAENLRPDLYIDSLDNVPLTQRLGMTMLLGLVGNIEIPRSTSSPTLTFRATETTDATESEPQWDSVTMSPKEGAAFFDWTRKLALQSSPSINLLAKNKMQGAIARGVDLAVINGSGSSGNPEGILNMSGINTVAMGANGDEPTRAKLVECLQKVAVANAQMGNLGWLINAATMGIMMATDVGTDTGKFLFDENTLDPTNVMGKLLGYKCGISNQVPSNLDKGASTGVCSAAIFTNWSQIFLGQWGAVDIMIDPYALAKSGGFRIICHVDVDVVAEHENGISVIKDLLTVIS